MIALVAPCPGCALMQPTGQLVPVLQSVVEAEYSPDPPEEPLFKFSHHSYPHRAALLFPSEGICGHSDLGVPTATVRMVLAHNP